MNLSWLRLAAVVAQVYISTLISLKSKQFNNLLLAVSIWWSSRQIQSNVLKAELLISSSLTPKSMLSWILVDSTPSALMLRPKPKNLLWFPFSLTSLIQITIKLKWHHLQRCVLSYVWLFCNPIDYSLPTSSVHRIFQARILQWVTISFSRGSSSPRDQTCVSCISFTGWQILYHPTAYPNGSVHKEAACNVGNTGDVGSIPGWERSPEVGNGNPL